MMSFVATYQLQKATTLFYHPLGTTDKLLLAYQEFLNGKWPRSLPLDLEFLSAYPYQTLVVSYGERQVLPIPLETWVKFNRKDERMWRNIVTMSLSIKLDEQEYIGESIAYDDYYPGVTADLHCLKALDENAKKIGHHQIISNK